VSFARRVNHTPKIAAVLFAASSLEPIVTITPVAVLIATGGYFSAPQVAETMSYRAIKMNAGQDLVANLLTSGLVIVASRFGAPISPRHVSSSALFGIVAVMRIARWNYPLRASYWLGSRRFRLPRPQTREYSCYCALYKTLRQAQPGAGHL
jgi:inorganic phosphate transporter, PiT family